MMTKKKINDSVVIKTIQELEKNKKLATTTNISKKTGFHIRTVQYHVQEMVERDVLERVDKIGTTYVYKIKR
ncbi:MAG: hypothetical protein ACOC80_16880 [Petrotogales bacterium]